MTYEFATGIVKNIIAAIENSAVASVRSLNSHIHSSKIVNFPKTQVIKGTVTVGNQQKVEREIKETRKSILDVLSFLRGFKLPKSIEVSNFPAFPKAPEYPKSIQVSNFPTPPAFPKEFRVSNQPTEQLENIANNGGEMVKALKALKLNPTIRVEAPKPERVIVPPSQVTVNEKEIDYEKLAEAVASQVPSIDYDKLAEAVGSKIAGMMVTTGGGSSSGRYMFQDSNGKHALAVVNALRQLMVVNEERWGLNNSAKVGTSTYLGEEDANANWILRKVTKSTGNTSMLYATKNNNPTIADYTDAWTNKADLTYDLYYEAFKITE